MEGIPQFYAVRNFLTCSEKDLRRFYEKTPDGSAAFDAGKDMQSEGEAFRTIAS
ncbi:hypothetical protein [Noviherbaspirillum saxi]|uniref:hypothetical protein n=1 Tax=Noviherbaspirillum saxi TaxID=2320863 RepID=UPI0013142F75|nr:hypothetical protein [Noviherbaspirillum saxi]